MAQAAFTNKLLNLEQRYMKFLSPYLLLLLSTVGFGYSWYRKRRRFINTFESLIAKNDELLAEKEGLLFEKEKLLRDKEWLVREVNHRVKNNLQIVMSLLNSHSNSLADPAAKNVIRDSQNRVHAISLIHQKLYQSDALSTIPMRLYIEDYIAYMSDQLAPGRQIQFVVEVDLVDLDVAQSVPLGLIIKEAVTNAVKYAFPGEGRGVISVRMHGTSSEWVQVHINDNGIGLPAGLVLEECASLGISLMRGLCRQLDGRLKVYAEKGTHVEIEFNKKQPATHGKENFDRRR
jgi:two-component sensor histidine kinase